MLGCHFILSRSRCINAASAVAGVALSLAASLGCGKSTPVATTTPSDSGLDAGGPPTIFPAGNLDCSADASDWPMFGQNVCNTNSQANAGISTTNVGTLGVKWVANLGAPVSATPTVVSGSVYVPDWGGNINRLDAATGSVTWSKSVGAILKSAGDAGASLPGFASRTAPVVTDGMVIFGALRGTAQAESPGASAYLIAIDQDTAAVKWSTLLESHEAAVIAGSPVLDGTTLYLGVSSQEEYATLIYSLFHPGMTYPCCTFRGSVVAVDVPTGKILWKTSTITDALYYSNDAGKLSGWAGAAIWSSTPVVDRKRHQIYVTTGNNYHSAPGEAEAGASDGNYVDSVLALDMTTGAVNWARSFPEGGEDVFTAQVSTGQDSDFGAGANLFTAMVKGVPKDLVGAGQKSGMYWALDADTGATVWSIQVGSGGHLGGIHWGTATDGTRIYVEDNFGGGAPFAIGGTGPQAGMMASTGTWAALDTGSGDILWQITNPAAPAPVNGASCNGPVAVTNGVLFAGSMDKAGTMFAFDAATGKTLWSFVSGGTVYGGPAIVGGVVYWGSGYPNGSGARPLGFGSNSTTDAGTCCNSLYALGLGLGSQDAGAADDGGTPADATSE